MRQITVLLTVLFSNTAFAADPQLMNLVMPDAKILAGVNATSAKVSPFGQFLISKIALNGNRQKFIAATGFDPLQDVSEVLTATAADPSNPGGILLALGTFPVDMIGASVGNNTNRQVQTYGGATLISALTPKGNVTRAVAFLGNTIAVAGDLASVKAAIDRSGGANSIDPALAVKVNQVSGSEDEWLVSSTSLASLLPAKASSGASATSPAMQLLPLLKNIQSFDGGVKLGPNVVLTGEVLTNSAQNAAALLAVMKLGLSLVASNSANNPQIGNAVQLLQTLQVTVDGSAVDLSLSIPEAQLEALVNSAPTKKVASRRRAPAVPVP